MYCERHKKRTEAIIDTKGNWYCPKCFRIIKISIEPQINLGNGVSISGKVDPLSDNAGGEIKITKRF